MKGQSVTQTGLSAAGDEIRRQHESSRLSAVHMATTYKSPGWLRISPSGKILSL